LQEASVATDADGAYAITGFPPGTSTLTVTTDPRAPQILHWPPEEITLTLAEGEERNLDVGGPQRLACWSGLVRTSRGDRISGIYRLIFDRIQGGAADPGLRRHLEVRLDADGRFEARLSPGTWIPSVQYEPSYARTLELPPRTIGSEDHHDLVVAGTRLRGALVDSKTREPRRARLLARREPTEFQPDPYECWPDWSKDGYVFEGLAPGEWTLTAEPEHLAAVEGALKLHIGAEETELTLDLEIQSP